jgi:DNA-binding transcriptional regulator YhcF (GntR family)
MPVVKRDFTYSQVKLMRSILNIRNEDNLISTTTIAKRCKVNPSNPHFRKILKQLEREGIINLAKIIGSTKLLRINRNELRDYIDEQKVTQENYDYFSEYHIISWRPGFG